MVPTSSNSANIVSIYLSWSTVCTLLGFSLRSVVFAFQDIFGCCFFYHFISHCLFSIRFDRASESKWCRTQIRFWVDSKKERRWRDRETKGQPSWNAKLKRMQPDFLLHFHKWFCTVSVAIRFVFTSISDPKKNVTRLLSFNYFSCNYISLTLNEESRHQICFFFRHRLLHLLNLSFGCRESSFRSPSARFHFEISFVWFNEFVYRFRSLSSVRLPPKTITRNASIKAQTFSHSRRSHLHFCLFFYIQERNAEPTKRAFFILHFFFLLRCWNTKINAFSTILFGSSANECSANVSFYCCCCLFACLFCVQWLLVSLSLLFVHNRFSHFIRFVRDSCRFFVFLSSVASFSIASYF